MVNSKDAISAASGMKSICEIYKIGRGPSSSHTIGPEKAAKLAKEKYPDADSFRVVLFGSLAKTGEGHGTDTVLVKTFAPTPADIESDCETSDLPHPNTMDIYAYKDEEQIGSLRVLSVGGGIIEVLGEKESETPYIYPHKCFAEIAAYCKEKEIRIWQYVEEVEGSEIWQHLDLIWQTMKDCIRAGLKTTGTLPGALKLQRKANFLFNQRHIDESSETRENRIVCSYAYAVSEQNAAGETIVTAPTCGASGVLPAVLLYQQEKRNFSDTDILHALATAGLIGNLIKTNASISGAECGCQAEIGSACSMASAALAELFGMAIEQVEYAAEVAMEHHLGLTCDPIYGLVQIPCIERNAVAAMRAINAVSLANFLSGTRKISFDLVVQTMYETGKDLSKIYRETSEGGLAKLY